MSKTHRATPPTTELEYLRDGYASAQADYATAAKTRTPGHVHRQRAAAQKLALAGRRMRQEWSGLWTARKVARNEL